MTAPLIWSPYCGAAPIPGEWVARWNFDPLLIAVLALMATAFAFRASDATRQQRRFLVAAIGLLLLLFISPFCALTSALFSARTVHHVLLGTVVAPLLVACLPNRLLPQRVSLAAATALQALVTWVWHAPPLYGWALSSDAAYWLMQATLLSSACAFWIGIRLASTPAAVAALLATMVQMGLLGALLTFSASALYEPHFLTTQAWGFAPLEDQQLAGLIMWAPAAGLYLGAALVLAGRWLGAAQRQASAR